MNPLLSLVQEPWAQALGWTLLHFLWQGALLGLLAWLSLALLRGASAKVRYGAACAFLLLMVAAPAATLLLLQPQGPAGALPLPPGAIPGPLAAPGDAPLALRVKAALDPALPWLLGGWAAGVLLLSGRFLGGWARVQRLRRRSAMPVPAEWHLVLSRLCRELKLSRTVRLLQSAAVEVPTALGWLRPVILVPACALAGLAPAQLEAILAHELAHIRRGDFLVNLLQSLVEVLLFYHPAVWWLSGRIRHERELCCDDEAAALCGDPLLLARALTELEALRESASPSSHHLALAANGGSLMQRIRHLLQPSLPVPGGARAAALALVAASLLGAGVALQDQGKDPAPKAERNTRMKVIDGDRQMDLQLKGEVKLDAAAPEPVAVPGDGSFRVEEKKGGKTRAYAASRDKRTYTVDGKEQPLDAEGQAWLREAVKDAARAEAGRDRARRVEVHTRHLEGRTRALEAQAKALEAQAKALEAPGLSPEERARLQAEVDKARAEAEKARAEHRRMRVEVIRGKEGEPGTVILHKDKDGVEKHIEVLTEDIGPGTVVIREKVDGKEVVEKRIAIAKEPGEPGTVVIRRHEDGKGVVEKRMKVFRKGGDPKEGGTWAFIGPEGEDGVLDDLEREIRIPPIPEIHIQRHEVDPQAEIRALRSAMKSMQKRLDQLQRQMATAPKPPRAPKAPTAPPPPPPPDAPPAPPAPPAPVE